MRMFRPLFTLVAAPLVAALPLAACGLSPYKIEIQQGNYVSQEMVSQLKAGMSKEQVRITLGTPLLTDLFHADRWDYVYWRKAPDGTQETRKVAVYFADGKLTRVDGDVVPAMEQPAKEAK